MPTDKRERQRAQRVAKTQAQQLAHKRTKRKRGVVRWGVILVFAVVAALLVSLLGGDGDDQEAATGDSSSTTASSVPDTTPTSVAYTNPELAEEVLAREAPDPEPPPEDLASDALNQSTLIEGEGEAAAENDTVIVHYVGKLADGTVFDESWSRGQTFSVTPLGLASVIDGWNQGLIGVKIGERRRLEIGSDLAYRDQGQGSIPPDAPLVFEIDIVDIIKAAAPPAG